MNAVLADGSVHNIRYGIDPEIFNALGNINGGGNGALDFASNGLVVRGMSRIHTSLGGGLMGPSVRGKVNINVMDSSGSMGFQDNLPSLQWIAPVMGLEAKITPGLRAVAVETTFSKVAGGFILPGSRVDVYYTLRSEQEGPGPKRLLENVLARAVDIFPAKPGDKRGGLPSMVTLELTPKQARSLIAMQELGASFHFSLRPFGDASGLFDPDSLSVAPSDGALYERPLFIADDRVFYDLVSYAPGLNTSAADIQAILEAEAGPDTPSATGQIDAKARQLIDKARGSGWQTVTFPDFKITFDGAGRYAFERTLPTGLYERVVCDGRTLWHLYPELGLGAKRTVSRFHRAELCALVPGILPPAEDLARDADLRSIDEHTVAIVPHASSGAKRGRSQAEPGNEVRKPKATYEIRLVFSPDGRLAERRIVQMPAEKVLARETYSIDGVVRVLDGDGKVRTTVRRALAPGKEPDLKPDLSKLVVVPMPLRTGEQSDKSGTTNEESAISLLAAKCLQQDSTALQLFKQRFHARGDRRLGFYTLLISGRMCIEPVYFVEEQPPSALRQYLANCDEAIRSGQRKEIGKIGGSPDGLIQRLAAFRDLGKKWQSGKFGQWSAAERQVEAERALDFVRRNKSSPFGWPMLSLVQDKIGDGKEDQLALAEAYRLFENVPYLAYPARYERARCLLHAGHSEEARTVFLDLYAETLKAGVVPPIDRAVAEALSPHPRPRNLRFSPEGRGEAVSWAKLMRRTSADLVADHRRLQALTLAWQSRLIGNQSLADDLFAQAMANLDDKERFVTSLAGIDYLIQTGQAKKAEKLLQPLLEEERYAKFPGLWRLAAWLGFLRENNARAASDLDRALDLEYAHLPDVIDLAAVRREYSRLLEQYLEVASELAKAKASPPRDFLPKVIRAGDRWRALDSDPTGACFVTARILKTLGREDLGWEYLTTPVGLRPNEAGPWLDLARALAQSRDKDWVDRAYRGAFEAEPSNAQILWDQAKNLQEAGKTPEARKLFQRIADGDWQSRFDDVKKEARRQLE
jgi:predicted Zn-dependent protease